MLYGMQGIPDAYYANIHFVEIVSLLGYQEKRSTICDAIGFPDLLGEYSVICPQILLLMYC